MITITLTGTTCNEACWHAKEPECNCSCGGANHGILLTAGTEQPRRNARINGHRYLLAGVGRYAEMSFKRYEIDQAHYRTFAGAPGASRRRYDDVRENGEAVIVKRATKDQVQRWPELRPFIDQDRAWLKPCLLWIREDLA